MIAPNKENDRALQSFLSAGFTKPQLIILGIAGSIIFIILLMVIFGFGLREDLGRVNVELEFWGVQDEPRAWSDTISKFESVYPNIKVRYTKLNAATYEKQLLDALAAGSGPDVFMFHNTWLPKHGNKIISASSEQIPLSTFRNLFPVVVEQDFAIGSQIFSLPLFVDTLALFYNRDIFDNKRIALAPVTWDELKATILKIREFKIGGGLSKAALSIGGTIKSVTNATDILNLLMLQFKTEMVSSDRSRMAIANSQGLEALNFYTQFSRPSSLYYTWSDSFKPSIDSFATKQTAMIMAYASEIPEIKAKNPALNFTVVQMPQFNKNEAINFANYWGLAVSAKASYPKEAWDFIIFTTTNSEVSSNYITLTGKPPALRFLINEYLMNPTLGIFAAQALTARSWPQIDNVEVKKSFDDMIESVLNGRLSSNKALEQAESEITSLMR